MHLRRWHKQICVDTPVEDYQSEDNHINDDQGEYDTSSSEDENSDLNVWNQICVLQSVCFGSKCYFYPQEHQYLENWSQFGWQMNMKSLNMNHTGP